MNRLNCLTSWFIGSSGLGCRLLNLMVVDLIGCARRLKMCLGEGSLDEVSPLEGNNSEKKIGVTR